MKKKLLIFGSGSQAKLTYNIAKQTKKFFSIKIISFIKSKKIDKKIIYLTQIKSLKNYIKDDTYSIVALGDNFYRKKLVSSINQKFKKFKFRLSGKNWNNKWKYRYMVYWIYLKISNRGLCRFR